MGNQRKRFLIAHLFFCFVLSFPIFYCACISENENIKTVLKRDIKAVMEAHTSELMAIPGVVGVAIGETEDRKPTILVLIIREDNEIMNKIPKELEGFPTSIVVSGEIKPLQGD